MGKVIEVEIAQGDLGCLQDLSVTELVLVELGGADDDELMEVGVGPAEGGLYHLMELGEVELERQQNSPPDERLDVGDRDGGLDDERAVVDGHDAG
jgi:hypothetical protein